MKRIFERMRPLPAPSPKSNLVANESGLALMGIVMISGVVMSMILMAPTVLRAASKQSQHNMRKSDLLDDTVQMRAFLKYPDACKRIMTELVRIEMATGLEQSKDHKFKQRSVTDSIQREGSLAPNSPSKAWIAPGPLQVILGEPLFQATQIYRATLRVEKIVAANVLAPRAEEIPVYITFGVDGAVNFCESTSISAKDRLTFEDRICRLQNAKSPDIIYNPLTHECQSPSTKLAKQ